VRGLGQRHRLIDALSELDVLYGTPVRDGICVVYTSGVPSNVVSTSSKVLKSRSDLTISLSVDVGLEICFIGPWMASANGPIRIGDTFKKNPLDSIRIFLIIQGQS
jgi:hypothetical protein